MNDFKAGKHSRDNHIIFFCECDYWDCEIYKVLDGSEVNASIKWGVKNVGKKQK